MKKIVDWLVVLMLIVTAVPLAVVFFPFVAAYQIADAWSGEVAVRLKGIIDESKEAK